MHRILYTIILCIRFYNLTTNRNDTCTQRRIVHYRGLLRDVFNDERRTNGINENIITVILSVTH